jgi:hypothetical protein
MSYIYDPRYLCNGENHVRSVCLQVRTCPWLGKKRPCKVPVATVCRTAVQTTALRLRLVHAGMAALLCMMHACLVAVSARERCLYVLLEDRRESRSAQNTCIQDLEQAVTSQSALCHDCREDALSFEEATRRFGTSDLSLTFP